MISDFTNASASEVLVVSDDLLSPSRISILALAHDDLDSAEENSLLKPDLDCVDGKYVASSPHIHLCDGCSQSFPVLFSFCCSSVSMYYYECKLKSKKQGRPGNKAITVY